MEVVKFVMDNWAMIIAAFCGICYLVSFCVRFANMPTAKQVENLKEWLKIAVVKAEKDLGAGTGTLKLHSVYDSAVIAFPWIARYMTFEKFSGLVDLALIWMKDQIDKNQNIKAYVESK